MSEAYELACKIRKDHGLPPPRRSKKGYLVPCVTHGDNKDSPSLNIGDKQYGGITLWCFGGCSKAGDGGESFKMILDELINRGYVDASVEAEEAPHFVECFDPRTGKFWAKFDGPGYQFVETYPRYDRETRTQVVAHKARFAPKTFKWFTRNPEDISKWKALKPKADEEIAPFYYPEVYLEKKERVLHWPEGEKDAKTLREGLDFASFSFGAVNDGIAQWFLDELVGIKGVIVWADNDTAGLKSAADRCLMLYNRKIPCKLAIPAVGKDITNWKAAGATKQIVEAYIVSLPLWVPAHEQNLAAQVAGLFPVSAWDVGSEAWAGDYLAHKFGDRLKCVAPEQKFYIYSEPVWERDELLVHHEYAKGVSSELKRDMTKGQFDQEQLKVLSSLADKAQTEKGMRSIIAMARSAPAIRMHLHSFDAQDTGHLFNCASGVIDMRTLKVHDSSPKFFLTKQSRLKVDFEKEPTEFIEFLHDRLKDKELVRYMQPLLGYFLTGDYGFQKFVLFTGKSGSGKSQLLDIMAEVTGDYMAVLNAQALRECHQRSAATDSELAQTHKKRLIVAHELSEKYKLDESVIKALTGGDPIQVKYMGKDKFPLKAFGKLVFTANERPPLSDDKAIARRLMEIQFHSQVSEEKIIDYYGQDLVRRIGPQIQGWLLKGAHMCYETRNKILYQIPEIVNTWVEDYINESNVVKAWANERLTPSYGNHEKSADLFSDFEKMCRAQRLNIDMDIKGFGRRLSDLGFKARKNHIDQRGFVDIKLVMV